MKGSSFFLSSIVFVLEIHMKLCLTELYFPDNFFCPKKWENVPKMGQTQGFFNLLKDFVIFTEFVL